MNASSVTHRHFWTAIFAVYSVIVYQSSVLEWLHHEQTNHDQKEKKAIAAAFGDIPRMAIGYFSWLDHFHSIAGGIFSFIYLEKCERWMPTAFGVRLCFECTPLRSAFHKWIRLCGSNQRDQIVDPEISYL